MATGSKPFVVACDLFKTQRLYRVPGWALKRLKARGIRVARFDPSASKSEPAAQVYWGNYFTKNALRRLPNMRWIHCASVGVNRAAVPEVAARGIRVTNSRGILGAPVAAAVMGFICGLARGFHHAGRLRARGRLNRDAFEPYFDQMRDLQGEICLVVGLGDAGSRVAKACAALGMRVWAIRERSVKPAFVEKRLPLSQLRAAAAKADFIVNLLPLTSRTRRVFDAKIFSKMKRSAFFINAGRGPTVDEKALASALKRRRIAGAGLDVFEAEPLSPRSPLWKLDNTFLTPHVACLSVNYWPRQIELLERNVARFKRRRPLLNSIDMSRGY